MDFIDLKAQQKRIKAQLDVNIQRVLAHGQYILGPEIAQLEKKLADYVGVKHALACASGTDALLMALMACKIGPSDAVFTSPFTFISTAEVISILGATPVFVDIDPATYNMDPAKLERAIEALKADDSSIHPLPEMRAQRSAADGSSPLKIADSSPHAKRKRESEAGLRPRAVIPVDIFGLPADYNAIEEIAGKHSLFVVEDAAQSFGAEYKGRKTCSFGQIGCTSFFPAKPLGCYGDGGMCFTDDDALADILDSIRVHGKGSNKYENARIGINGRFDTLQAAILLAKFDIFPEEIELRQVVAGRYTELLLPLKSPVPPRVLEGCRSAWAQYSVLAKNDAERTALMDKLNKSGIPTAIYYPRPLHLQAAFADLGYQPGDFPVSESVANRIFSLPMHPYLTEEDQREIVHRIGAQGS
jgi:UDP-2-acetamido-2-deoxy-ribo-hexuluronate aminotransferase